MKYNFVYKITNNINGDYYYGVHSTNNLDDGYMGSGARINRSINKYGKENFTREIVQFFSSSKCAYSLEAAIVTSELISDKHCLNIAKGGHGGDTISGYNDEERKTFSEKLKQSHTPIVYNEEVRKKMSEARKGKKPWNKGIKCREETKEKLRQYKGNKSSMYGQHVSAETKEQLRAGQTGRSKKYNIWNKGTPGIYTEEYKKKISQALTGKHWKLVDGTRVWY